MTKENKIKRFYEDMAENHYHPLDNVQSLIYRKGIRKLISFDDRFLVVKETLEKEIKKRNGVVEVLDIAAGDGVYESILNEGVKSKAVFDGIDFSEAQKKKTKKIFRNFYLCDLDKQPIPIKNKKYDIIIISEILEHLFFPDEVLYQANKLLSKDGVLILTSPNSAAIRNGLTLLFLGTARMILYPEEKQHIRFYNFKSLKSMLESAGFEIADIKGTSGFFLQEFNFGIKILTPRILQILTNKLIPKRTPGILIKATKRV